MNSIFSGRMTAWASGAWALLDRNGLIRDEPITIDEALLERTRLERVPLRRETALDLAVGLAVLPEDEAAGIAERTGVPLGVAGRGGRIRA